MVIYTLDRRAGEPAVRSRLRLRRSEGETCNDAHDRNVAAAPTPLASSPQRRSAFNANKTSWIGLRRLPRRRRAGDPRAAARAVRSATSRTSWSGCGRRRRALARHRQFRPRHAVARSSMAPASRSSSASCSTLRGHGDRDGDRHARRLARRPLRHGRHAGDGRAAGLSVADPRADRRGDARPVHANIIIAIALDVDPAVRSHRAGADHRGQGARLRRGRPRARLLRHAHSSTVTSCRTSCPKSW